MAEFHSHQAAFVIEQDNGANLFTQPIFGKAFGEEFKFGKLLRGWDTQRAKGDHIDIDLGGAGSRQTVAESGGGFGLEDAGLVEDEADGCGWDGHGLGSCRGDEGAALLFMVDTVGLLRVGSGDKGEECGTG